ncbi:hypothetical protein EDD86DRAFT_207543 [Gorgonomyces haynaldii]|nr:hypothetical protein EDD86DRAFT_207543 [Gorgonomyces haynaldii]
MASNDQKEEVRLNPGYPPQYNTLQPSQPVGYPPMQPQMQQQMPPQMGYPNMQMGIPPVPLAGSPMGRPPVPLAGPGGQPYPIGQVAVPLYQMNGQTFIMSQQGQLIPFQPNQPIIMPIQTGVHPIANFMLWRRRIVCIMVPFIMIFFGVFFSIFFGVVARH